LEPLRTALVLVLDDARPALEPVRSEFHAEAAARVIPLHIPILFPPHATLPEGVPRETVERRCAALLPLACYVDQVALLVETAPDRWGDARRFPLSGDREPAALGYGR
jgi:hypothetical protein